MVEAHSKYKCPSCNRGVLNRKVDRCLYCGATLPSDLLFSKEEIAALDEQERARREKKHQTGSGQAGFATSGGFDPGDVIDIISDLGDLS